MVPSTLDYISMGKSRGKEDMIGQMEVIMMGNGMRIK